MKRWLRLVYLAFSVAVLASTSAIWTLTSACLQDLNADNLIDGFMFQSAKVFHGAQFPGAHTFLLKWPLFVISSIFGNSLRVTHMLILLCVAVTVGALVLLLATIEKRPLVLGSWLLVISCILILVPDQAQIGALLPVNFAMLTTRNIEYAFFLLGFVLISKATTWRDWRQVSSVAVLGILIASDKLFMPLALAGLLFGGLLVMRTDRQRALRLVGGGIAAIVLAYALLGLIVIAGITGIPASSSASPYHIVTQPRTIALAGVYAVLGLLTIFGANPGYGHLSLAGWPAAVLGQNKFALVAYAVNAAIFVCLIWLAIHFFGRQVRSTAPRSALSLTTMMLLGASTAAIAIYALTDHYYPVDSRYLTITFFALMLAAASTLATRKLSKWLVLGAGAIALLATPLGVMQHLRDYHAAQATMLPQQTFNAAVAAQLNKYHVKTVLGDYWDVTPIRAQTAQQPAIVPLSNCTDPQLALTSTAWRHAALAGSVAYIYNSHPEIKTFGGCSTDTIQKVYGTPTRRVSINTPGHQGSYVYIYDVSVKHVVVKPRPQLPPSNELRPYANCDQGNVLQIVAHEDDDILFMNPDVQTAINSGECVTTVYLTAGDAGTDYAYMQARQAGARAAYANMYKRADHWQRQAQIIDGRVVQSAQLQGVTKMRLLFLNLPDGNINGQGFSSQHFESLSQLRSGTINSISENSGLYAYTEPELVHSLISIMDTLQPTEVHTQDYNPYQRDGDHSDHHAAGYFAKQAFDKYAGAATLRTYIGYPGRALPANVNGAELDQKTQTFFAYGAHDGAVCHSVGDCRTAAYGTYLPRQYSHIVAERALFSEFTHSDISSTRTPEKVLTQGSGGGCVISDQPQSIYCTKSH